MALGGATAAGVTLGFGELSALAQAPAPAPSLAVSPAVHLLKRITWGVRPADVAPVETLGTRAYIEYQLAYESIPDPAVEAFVSNRRAMTMSAEELRKLEAERYDVVYELLVWSRLYRAIASERQLYEMMVEFWTDHFNIPAPDYLSDKFIDDRDVIRRHALGNFRDLLLASAQSVAMLRYLDNAVSTSEHPNENYARELMELHTLGVDGGYSERDVVEVARAFTGWTLTENYYTARFTFNMNIHDRGEKVVLGVGLPAERGIEDGLQVLDILANHPSTARHIAYKLCRRFVSDFPPESIVQSTAEAFTNSRGDIRATLRHLLNAPEFYAAQGQKFRKPTEFLVAMIRALHPALQIESGRALFEPLEMMAHLPFHWFPPNGYPDVAGAWTNTNGLLHRWNTALALANAGDGYFWGAVLNLENVIPQASTVGELVDVTAQTLLHAPLPPSARQHLLAFMSRTADEREPVTPNLRHSKLGSLVGLIFASPYFQWR